MQQDKNEELPSPDFLYQEYEENQAIEPEDKPIIRDIEHERKELTACLIQSIKEVAAWKGIDANRLTKQITASQNIIEGILQGKKNFIVQAPTGFGKSILALVVGRMLELIADKKLYHDHKLPQKPRNGYYILTPNKFLQDQYQGDIDKFNLHKTHAQLKGQANYLCTNSKEATKGTTFANRPCHKTSISMLEDKWKCATNCPYVVARKHAINASCTVFNYNYWLTTLNYIFTTGNPMAPFHPRTLTVFDEAHLLSKIVQDMFSYEWNFDWMRYKILSNYNNIYSIYGANMISEGMITKEDNQTVIESVESLTKLQVSLNTFANQKSKSVSTYRDFLNVVEEIRQKLNKVSSIFSVIINKNFPKDPEHYSDNQTELAEFAEELDSLVGEVTKLKDFYENIDISTMVINTKEHVIKGRRNDIDSVQIRCVLDAYLIQKHVLPFTEYSLFMSASIGESVQEIEIFAQTNGIDNPHIIVHESDFDFSESPIIMVKPLLNMGYKDKHRNMPFMLKNVHEVVHLHKNTAGVIHTGNYEFMNKLQEYVDANWKDIEGHRFLWCNTAKSKTENVQLIKNELSLEGKSDKILVGPGLLEGVDLKDDMARFSILMKVPYPSMQDELVKRKMEYYNNWYSWATMMQVLQAIGRGNRHKKDWCITYLLDGGFNSFFWRYGNVPRIIQTRLLSTTIEGSAEIKEAKERMRKLEQQLNNNV